MTKTYYYYDKIEIDEEEFFARMKARHSHKLTTRCECLNCGCFHDIADICNCSLLEYEKIEKEIAYYNSCAE